jgi:membrane-associated HD superfamily phosphohydrolase
MGSKGIILLVIFVAWKIYSFYKKSVAENEDTVAKRSKNVPGREKKKSIFDELLEQVEQGMGQQNTPQKSEPVMETVSSEKKDWEFGVDELKTSEKAHSRHSKYKEPVIEIEELSSEADEIAEDFDLKKAIVYSEILNAPYIER